MDSGYWPLYRFDPRRIALGESPLKIDSAPGKTDLGKYMRNETRFRMVEQQNPKRFAHAARAGEDRAVTNRFVAYEHLAKLAIPVRQDAAPADEPTGEKSN